MHGKLVELYSTHLIEVGLAGQGTWRCLNVVRDLLTWMATRAIRLTNLDERLVERYLQHRGEKQTIQPGDRVALKRWFLILRTADKIAPPPPVENTPQEQIFAEFSDYLRHERGLAERTIVSHLPAIRRFLFEVCPAGASDLGKIRQEEVIRYIERHARDWSPSWLALPDAAIFNASNLKTILLVTYARSQPVFGFTATMVTAGAAASAWVPPAMLANDVAEMYRAIARGAEIANPRYSSHFDVVVNESVLRSLSLPVAQTLKQMRRAP